MVLFLPAILFFLAPSSRAAESIFSPEKKIYETTIRETQSSFEVLGDDPILKKRKFSNLNPDLSNALLREVPFQTQTYGYPAGSLGSPLGGRSIDDAQVMTLGIPLVLPQGGGPDFSQLPGYLWSSYEYSMTPSQAGNVPQASSGSLELKPWTREVLKTPASDTQSGRLVSTYDRQVQTISLGVRYEKTAIVAGNSFGLLSGPAGSFTHAFVKNSEQQIQFHVLGSSLEGMNYGSRVFPTPNDQKTTWRLIPALETSFKFTDDWSLQSTVYADLSSLKTENPGVLTSDSRTWQYGIENAVKFQDYTLGLSARYVVYDATSSSGFVTKIKKQEWPIHASFTRKIQMDDRWIALAGIHGDYLSGTGGDRVSSESNRGVGGKLGVRFNQTQSQSFFAEGQSLSKMPTITARYYPGFENPNLRPERVNLLLLGHDFHGDALSAVTTLKLEQRRQVQLSNSAFIIQNQGTANLVSLDHDLRMQLASNWGLGNEVLFVYSKIENTHFSYPDLPRVSDRFKTDYTLMDWVTAKFYAGWMGDSQSFNGSNHAGYALYDFELSHEFKSAHQQSVFLALGLANIFDRRAEPVLGYPLPGRMITASLNTQF